MNDLQGIHKGWIRESNLIEKVDDRLADEESWEAWKKFTEKILCRTSMMDCHWDILKRLNHKIAGSYRVWNVEVDGRLCPHWKRVPNLMNQWFQQWGRAKTATSVKQAHIKFQMIHPFADGNGRVGRMMMNHQLVAAGLEPFVIYEKEKERYYEWFRSEQNKQMEKRLMKMIQENR